jgi:hypothetical protein
MLSYFFKVAPSNIKNLKIFNGLLTDYSLVGIAGLLCNFAVNTPQKVL